ncbi:CP family cyanate transporter-like MFS transporter [Tumebacillus sp. BK434]|uniref:CynX/NimT family MFS transporter n=1 Tax=Tumebacillus sp. BK434 TaxID=2512169 RepID=UPI00104BECA2|nr:MFS transporter [Tumebacillus sp. BK434]TCP54454.1 CP family cyanate transporter-like MFS transporter [Tumebacillus sp. BK434]
MDSNATIQKNSMLLLFGIILIASNLRGAITAVGPLVGEIRIDTGLSNTFAGMLTTLPLLAFAAISPLAPKIARRFGTENTLFGGLLLLAAGILLRSAPSAGALIGGTMLIGFAIAVGNVLLPSLIKRDYAHRVGKITGLYTLAMCGFASLGSGLSVPLSEGLGLGWQLSLMSWALLAVLGILLWYPQVRPLPVSTEREQAAEQVNRSLWKSPLAWQVTLFMGLQSFGFFAAVSWLPELLHSRGLSPAAAGWMVSFMQIIGLPATFFVPVLAGRRPSQRRLVLALASVFFIGYAGLFWESATFVWLWVLLLGIGQGGSISLALTFLALRAQTPRAAAELSGMSQSLGYLLAASGPFLFGWLHDLTGGWTASLLVLVLSNVGLLAAGLGAGRDKKVS